MGGLRWHKRREGWWLKPAPALIDKGSCYYMGYETGRAGDAADLEDHVEDQFFGEPSTQQGKAKGKRARAALRSPTSVCATDRFDRGRVCDDVRDERCSRGVFRCRGG